MLNQDEKTVARILVDQYQAQATATQQSPQRLPIRVTVKPVKGYPNVLKRVTEVLALLAQRIVSFDDPLDSTLAAFNVVPDYTLTSFDVPLNPNTPPEVAARQFHVHLLKMLRHQEAGVREDLDTQFLHNFRTAISRIRAVIKEIPGVFSQKTAKHFNGEFRWLEEVTANKRNLDLQRLAMEKSHWRLDNKYEAATLNAFLTDHMTHELKKAQHDLNQALDSQRYTTLLHEWIALLQNSSLSDYEATDNAGLNGTSAFNNHGNGIVDGYDGYSPNGHANTIKMFAQQAIQSRFDRIVREGQRIKASSRPQKLHDIRVDCTRLHNLLDFFRSLFDDGYFSSVVTSLKSIEKHLHQFDSLATQQDHIEQFAQALAADPSADHRILLSLGKISERLYQAHEEKRRTFHKRFDNFTDQATHQSLAQMLEPLDSASLL